MNPYESPHTHSSTDDGAVPFRFGLLAILLGVIVVILSLAPLLFLIAYLALASTGRVTFDL